MITTFYPVRTMLLLLIAWGMSGFNNEPVNAADAAVFARCMAVAPGKTKVETLLKLARQFEGSPYVAGTLEKDGPERLVINLQEFDCWTFVENVLALAQTRHAQNPDLNQFQANLQRLRYQNGLIHGYGSRHHYFFAWLRDQEQRNVLTFVTDSTNARPYPKKINFMTMHRSLYPGLANDADFQRCVQAETRINERLFYFIPKSEVKNFESRIADGDLVGVTTTRDGLDVSHEGIAVRQNGRVYLLHASSEHRRVMVSPVPLAEYLARNRQQSGIVVVRLMS